MGNHTDSLNHKKENENELNFVQMKQKKNHSNKLKACSACGTKYTTAVTSIQGGSTEKIIKELKANIGQSHCMIEQ